MTTLKERMTPLTLITLVILLIPLSAASETSSPPPTYHISGSPELDFFLHREDSLVAPPSTLGDASRIRQLLYEGDYSGQLVGALYNNGCLCMWNEQNCTKCVYSDVEWIGRLGKTTLVAASARRIVGLNQHTGAVRWQSDFDLVTGVTKTCASSRFAAFYAHEDAVARSWSKWRDGDSIWTSGRGGGGGGGSGDQQVRLYVAVFDIKNNQGLSEIVEVPTPEYPAGPGTRSWRPELDLLACTRDTLWITQKTYTYYEARIQSYQRASVLHGASLSEIVAGPAKPAAAGKTQPEWARLWKPALLPSPSAVRNLKVHNALLTAYSIRDVCLTEYNGVATLNTGHVVAWGCNSPNNPLALLNGKIGACPSGQNGHLSPASLGMVHVIMDPEALKMTFSGKLACKWSEAHGLTVVTRETTTSLGQVVVWSTAAASRTLAPLEQITVLNSEKLGTSSKSSSSSSSPTHGFLDAYRTRLQTPIRKKNGNTVSNFVGSPSNARPLNVPGVSEDATEPGDATGIPITWADIVVAVSLTIVFIGVATVMIIYCDLGDPNPPRTGPVSEFDKTSLADALAALSSSQEKSARKRNVGSTLSAERMNPSSL